MEIAIVAKTKAANYSEAQIADMTTMYRGVDNKAEVAAIAEKLGKSPASVRAKLASLGVYVKPKAAATASSRSKKADIVAAIAKAGVPLNEAEMEGLEKATASALNKVLARLTN